MPEENSLYLKVAGELFEIPSNDLVFYKTRDLLGGPVEARFGQDFPIRFDFLDTMGGGNLSLQVHPVTQYIRDTFGIYYTQDELLPAGCRGGRYRLSGIENRCQPGRDDRCPKRVPTDRKAFRYGEICQQMACQTP